MIISHSLCKNKQRNNSILTRTYIKYENIRDKFPQTRIPMFFLKSSHSNFEIISVISRSCKVFVHLVIEKCPEKKTSKMMALYKDFVKNVTSITI